MSTPRARRRVVVDQSDLARQIGRRLREARLAAGLTQQKLAGERYTKAYVSALENGLSKPSMAALTFFAERLQIPAAQLIGDGSTADQDATWTRLEADLLLAGGHWLQAVDAYRGLLDRHPPARVRAELLLGLAEAMARLDRGAEAAAAAGEAAQLFTDQGRRSEAALARYWLACGQDQQGHTGEAAAALRDLLEQVRGGLTVEPDFELRTLRALASNAAHEGRHDVAVAYLDEIRRLAERLDDRRRAAYLSDLAHTYREAGDYEAAMRNGVASLALFRAAESEFETTALENDLALSYLALGDAEQAAALAASARARSERLGDDRLISRALHMQARVALARDAHDEAGALAQQALELAERTGDTVGALDAMLTLARIQIAGGQPQEALRWYERAAELAREVPVGPRSRQILAEWAELLAAAGDHKRAFELARRALQSS
jgi:transcriptional regulator with XRE-family HTH domain